MNVCLASLQAQGPPQGGDAHLLSVFLSLSVDQDVSLIAFRLQNDFLYFILF